MIGAIADRATFEALSVASRVRSRSLWIRYTPDGSEPARVAFALERRIGNAVKRNRTRRRVLGQLRGADSLELPAGAYLIGATRDIGTRSTSELREELTELRRKILEQVPT